MAYEKRLSGQKRVAEDVGSYLESFLESANSLPSEITRSFTLMRELDAKARDLQMQLDRDCKDFIQNKSLKTSESISAFTSQLKADQLHCQNFCDEKISLAMQTYERVDGYIRQLDADLKRFEEEMKSDPSLKTEKKELPSYRKKNTESSSGHAVPVNGDEDLAVDPNEPTWCICKQVSFGEMIACDNQDCTIEWFHFQCVGLTQSPKTTWYCQDCRAKIRQGLLKI